jgi:phenylalanyl-tRNA synthetase beta chain
MKISYNWLKDYLKFDKTPNEISEILTNTGLEVEGIQTLGNSEQFDGLVVGEVLEKVKHPNADKLALTKVNIGESESLQIVCGAPNVAQGQKVVVATVGTTLFPTGGAPFKIKKGKIRGEVSFGMICAEDEIGLGTDHDGIMVLDSSLKPGTPIKSIFQLEVDYIFEIGLTPNRSDAMSHIGTARDIMAAINVLENTSLQLEIPKAEKLTQTANLPIDIKVENTEACPRYAGLTIDNIKIGPSPEWLQKKLSSVGVKSINNVVDITNFVLKELGQPLHAFDYKEVKDNQIIVKTVKKDTIFTTLDAAEIKLHDEDLMICNSESPMCIAGVFGGAVSGVKATTTSIFLESAYFNSDFVRKTSTRHQLRTDAATRYEKGADPNMVLPALNRAASLICELTGGEIASEIIDIYPEKIQDFEVVLNLKKLHRLIGTEIPIEKVKLILKNLDIKIHQETNESLQLKVPPYRADVQREADVIEEILRIYGFNNIQIPSSVKSTLVFRESIDKHAVKEAISHQLSGLGFSEIMTNSISKSSLYPESLKGDLVNLQNSMTSELDVMRNALIPDMLEVVAHNINRKNSDLAFFEFGNIYHQDFSQSEKLVLIQTGNQGKVNWINKPSNTDFFQLKGILQSIFTRYAIEDLFEETRQDPWLDDALTFKSNGKEVATIGSIKPAILKNQDIKQAVFYAELDLKWFFKKLNKSKVKFREIPKFPQVKRDLAILMDTSISFAQVNEKVKKAGGQLLKEVELFDIYKDEKKLGPGKKSYALSFTLVDDKKTLTDKEIDKILTKIIRTLEQDLNVSIRQ